MKIFLYSIILLITCSNCSHSQTYNKVIKLEMYLSAFGVESDSFPSIDVLIDFQTGSSICKKSYYNPTYKNSEYSLKQETIKKIQDILSHTNLKALKKEYRVSKTDQPTSVIIIYTQNEIFKIKDYGLEGESPLKEIYELVYLF